MTGLRPLQRLAAAITTAIALVLFPVATEGFTSVGSPLQIRQPTTTTTATTSISTTALNSFRKDDASNEMPNLIGQTVAAYEWDTGDAAKHNNDNDDKDDGEEPDFGTPDKLYLLREILPFASAKKCLIYEACRVVLDVETGEATTAPSDDEEASVIVKISANVDALGWESNAYQTLGKVLSDSDRQAFVKTYGLIPASPATGNCAGLVMERGSDNLRFQIRKKGAFRGTKLKEGMHRVIRIVDTLHSSHLVWTEIKAENFIVLWGQHTLLKGIDLESIIPTNYWLKTYSAEACPPEFPVEEIYKSLPKIKVSPQFDMWGLGLVLYEMATGKPLYEAGLLDVEYIRNELRNIDATMERANQKLLLVPAPARAIIQRCLSIDPNQRPSTQDLLNDPYFEGLPQTGPGSVVI